MICKSEFNTKSTIKMKSNSTSRIIITLIMASAYCIELTTSQATTRKNTPPTRISIENYEPNINDVQMEKISSNSSSSRKENLFSVNSHKFARYLENLDLTIIPGLRDDDDFENWTPSQQIQRDVPIYISGFDNQNRTIWVVEWGRYRFSKYAKGDQKTQSLFNKYVRYIGYLGLKSHTLRKYNEQPIDQHVLILDMEGLQPDLLTDRQTLQYQFQLLSSYRRYVGKHVSKTIILNVNSLSETLLSVANSVVVLVAKKLEVYGTNKGLWAPELLKSFPKDQIPEWYGGSKDFKPLYVVG